MTDFDPQNDIRAKRIIYYLKIADGWDQKHFFITEAEAQRFDRPAWHEARLAISLKAINDKYESVESALANFVPAAIVLHAYRAILVERAQHNAIVEAEKAARNEALRLQQITAAQQELDEKAHALARLRESMT